MHIWHKEGKFQRDKKDCLKDITKKDTSHVGTQEPRATTENETENENEVITSFESVESNRKRSNSTEAPVQRKKRKPSKAAKGNAMETMSSNLSGLNQFTYDYNDYLFIIELTIYIQL